LKFCQGQKFQGGNFKIILLLKLEMHVNANKDIKIAPLYWKSVVKSIWTNSTSFLNLNKMGDDMPLNEEVH
jgi:hypothetical protein